MYALHRGHRLRGFGKAENILKPDDGASKEGYLRVIDESGEDYLYPVLRQV